MPTATAADDDEELKRKKKADEEEKLLISQIQEDLWKPITDPIKESTADYYYQNKDKVMFYINIIKFYFHQII